MTEKPGPQDAWELAWDLVNDIQDVVHDIQDVNFAIRDRLKPTEFGKNEPEHHVHERKRALSCSPASDGIGLGSRE